MLTTAKIKELRSYQQKKFRDKTDFFIAETPKVVETLIASGVRAVEIYALSSWIERWECRFTARSFVGGRDGIAGWRNSVADVRNSVAEGRGSIADGQSSTADVRNSVAEGRDSIAGGQSSVADIRNSVAEGRGSITDGRGCVVGGRSSIANRRSSVADGRGGVGGSGTEGKAELVAGTSVGLVEISAKELERISGLVTPHEVVAVFEMPRYAPLHNGANTVASNGAATGISLILDDIRDPGNMGTIIRLADWFGIDRIIASENSADVFQPKCVQASMGSVGNVPVYYNNLSALAAKLPQGFPIYGTFMSGASIYKTPLERSNAWFVIGNEAHGINEEFVGRITHKISIPSFATAGRRATAAESLNAAMATAIICSEVRR